MAMAERTADNINPKAREFYNKAISALERNNLDYCIEMFQQCLALEPNLIQARKFLRAAQMKRSESQGGLKRMMLKAQTAPLMTKAKMAVSKNPVEAMALAEQILSEDPKNGQALTLLAEAAEAAKFPETAIQTLEHYTKLSSRDTKALHWLARLYATINRHDMAREIYDRLLQINPSDFDAQKGAKDATAKGAMQTGGWEEAGSYRDVMKDKEEAVALEQDARVVRAEDVIENHIQEKLTKLSQEPDSPVIRRDLGKLYAQKGDFDTALSYLEKLFAEEAGADPTLEKEISETKAKRITAKIAEKKKQLTSNPANAAAIQNEIATLEQEHDQLQLAEASRLVEHYPNDLMYRFDLGVLYMKTGNTQGAVEQLQKSVSQPQRRIASLNYLGQCFQQMGLHDLAIDQYTKAIEEIPMMDGLKKELLYNLASAYEAIGENDKAVSEYKKIAAVDFGFKDVREKITRKPPPKPS
jgi:tetratricopeptide (TPR) repeat protein